MAPITWVRLIGILTFSTLSYGYFMLKHVSARWLLSFSWDMGWMQPIVAKGEIMATKYKPTY
jgi:hypothetical protein